MKEYNGILNISEPDNDYSIYIMYSSNKEDNSIYIGVTQDYKQRCYKHSSCRHNKGYSSKPLYKWLINVIEVQKKKIMFEVIEKGYTEEEAFNREVILVKEYRERGYNVLNLSNGGKGHNGYKPWNKGKTMSKEFREKLSEAHLGIPNKDKGCSRSKETKEKIRIGNIKRKERGWVNPRRRAVYKYDLNNNLLVEYTCLKEAGEKEGVSFTSIGEWCRGEKKPRNKSFIWSYDNLIHLKNNNSYGE